MNEIDDVKTIEWSILPNTGHHYKFVPFSAKDIERLGGKQGEIAKLCRSSKKSWCELDKFSWVRYRYGYKGRRSNIGVWLAVESNIGDVTRGTFISEREVDKMHVPEESGRAVSPYRFQTLAELKNKSDNGKQQFSIAPLVNGKNVAVAVLEIVWQNPNGAPIDVDLIVDFGNTRTVVLALENNTTMVQGGQLNSVCRNIYSLPRGNEYPARGDEEAYEGLETIVDSWFMLQEPQFSEWDYPSHENVKTPFVTTKHYVSEIVEVKDIGWRSKRPVEVEKWKLTERSPQMFVEISPAFMGAEAKESYHNVDLSPGLNICMSSPKRYLWDREMYGNKEGGQLPWNMEPNPWNENRPKNDQFKLRGQICRYMRPDGTSWHIDNPPYMDPVTTKRPHWFPENPCYPRSSAMVWSALSILENAYRQITSFEWREGNNNFTPRRFRSVNVTYPSGWIAQEKEYYREAWQQAVNIFTLAHMQNKEELGHGKEPDGTPNDCDGRPMLNVELDEAVASQLPFIYSEVKRLNAANLWIRLYGRKDGPGNDHHAWRVRVMTVDIGGGTCDTSIVEYRNDIGGDSIALRYNVLFKDCSSFAGDAVMKRLIESVLLPSILKMRNVDEDSDEYAIFADVLEKSARQSAADRAKWQRITSMLFLPLVRQWLTDVANCPSGVYKDDAGMPFRTVNDNGVDPTALEDFNNYLKDARSSIHVELDDRLEYDPDEINACIREELQFGIEPLGKYISAFDIDLVTLSGKISEMPVVHDLLCTYLPLRPQRIIRMKNFLAGGWYPMAKNNRITDAKSVTAIGAALYCAANSGLLGAGFAIQKDIGTTRTNTKNYWGIMKRGRDAKGFNGEPILLPHENDNSAKLVKRPDGQEYRGTEMMIGEYIGRQKYYSSESSPEQQYKLHWTGNKVDAPKSPIVVLIERVPMEKEGDEDDIRLAGVEFTSSEEQNLDASKVVLLLNTLPEEGFWMDEACFEVKMPDAQ